MSHMARTKIMFKDLQCLITAGENIGLVFHEGKKNYRWYGRWVGDSKMPEGLTVNDLGKCTHAFSVKAHPQAYELGIVQQPNGTYNLQWDWWAGGHGLQATIGYSESDAGKLESEYSIQVCMKVAKANGMFYERTGDTLKVYTNNGMVVIKGGTVDAQNFVGQGCSSVVNKFTEALGTVTEMKVKPEFYIQEQQMTQGM